ncbi:phytanoyl-CoA dioxygenase family protein [Kiloniella laminariae]|uniref:phytanoyl-CoA dioxygenase family protein n=1 Tax=Kiloniella laminariae TaxID=454162 RepID=UPI00036C952F|nr:phytanoyl-CoA dioxygenase family protein [Kiloniella laminariae]
MNRENQGSVNEMITDEDVAAYQRDGAVCIPGLFKGWVDDIIAAIDQNMREPGPYAADNLKAGEQGRFFDDYCNWTRLPALARIIEKSPMAEAAARLMGSKRVQLFHDHVLVKEPGTAKATPWHQDAPYYFVEGRQTLSFWIPVDPVREASLRLVAGSHRWDKMVLPTRWLNEDNFYPDQEDFLPVPDPDAEPDKYRVLEWPMAPGDAVAFDFRTLHGARGNLSGSRRRALSLRLVGDDARYVTRPGPTSPPFPGHNMTDGQTLREDWFPVVWSA